MRFPVFFFLKNSFSFYDRNDLADKKKDKKESSASYDHMKKNLEKRRITINS
jgi:hypothetical protein